MSSRLRLLVTALTAALAGAAGMSLGSAPLHADWIVTRQGERFEIKGTWQLKGKLAIFTLPNGSLSSMRADRIDVDASKQATALAKQQAEPQPPPAEQAKPKRRAVIILTDKDFKKAPPPESAAAATPDAAAKTANSAKKGGNDNPPDKGGPSGVEVVGWERVPALESKANGVELTGTVRNTSQNSLTEVTVVADLFDDSGGLIGRFPAVVDNQLLPPTESSKFHLVAAGVFAFGSIRWETTSRGFKAVPPSPDNLPPSRPPG